jgi:hypothetical protein
MPEVRGHFYTKSPSIADDAAEHEPASRRPVVLMCCTPLRPRIIFIVLALTLGQMP